MLLVFLSESAKIEMPCEPCKLLSLEMLTTVPELQQPCTRINYVLACIHHTFHVDSICSLLVHLPGLVTAEGYILILLQTGITWACFSIPMLYFSTSMCSWHV